MAARNRGKRLMRIRKARTCTQCGAYLAPGTQVMYYNERHIYGLKCHPYIPKPKPPNLSLPALPGSLHCPFCKSEFLANVARVTCSKCRTRHHSDCWELGGNRCSIFGCNSMASDPEIPIGQAVLPTAYAASSPPSWQRPAPQRPSPGWKPPWISIISILFVIIYGIAKSSSAPHTPIPSTPAIPVTAPSFPSAPSVGYTPAPTYNNPPSSGVAENGSYYGEISTTTGRPKTTYVGGYYRKDGTYVRSHYRSK